MPLSVMRGGGQGARRIDSRGLRPAELCAGRGLPVDRSQEVVLLGGVTVIVRSPMFGSVTAECGRAGLSARDAGDDV